MKWTPTRWWYQHTSKYKILRTCISSTYTRDSVDCDAVCFFRPECRWWSPNTHASEHLRLLQDQPHRSPPRMSPPHSVTTVLVRVWCSRDVDRLGSSVELHTKLLSLASSSSTGWFYIQDAVKINNGRGPNSQAVFSFHFLTNFQLKISEVCKF